LQHSGAAMRLGRPCVVGAVQVAPARRIRPRGGQQYGRSLSLSLSEAWVLAQSPT
jgi:hypothetical protein